MKKKIISKPIDGAEQHHRYTTKQKATAYWGLRYEGEPKIRKCLRCDKKFESTGNRICKVCHEVIARYDPSAESF